MEVFRLHNHGAFLELSSVASWTRCIAATVGANLAYYTIAHRSHFPSTIPHPHAPDSTIAIAQCTLSRSIATHPALEPHIGIDPRPDRFIQSTKRQRQQPIQLREAVAVRRERPPQPSQHIARDSQFRKEEEKGISSTRFGHGVRGSTIHG